MITVNATEVKDYVNTHEVQDPDGNWSALLGWDDCDNWIVLDTDAGEDWRSWHEGVVLRPAGSGE